ncbi:MAG: hypothetical protein HY922_14370 [Elusimicrobia bacterium]|nr:hypothetical protein [Elusimicrobiota bacterium]
MTKDQLRLYCEAEFENIEKVLAQLGSITGVEKEYSVAELAAVATFLHNAYNGIENILKRVLTFEGAELKDSPSWHKELLKMSNEKKTIPENLYLPLSQLLSFRHFFIHSYVFVLKWDNLKPLVENIVPTYESLKNAVRNRFETGK